MLLNFSIACTCTLICMLKHNTTTYSHHQYSVHIILCGVVHDHKNDWAKAYYQTMHGHHPHKPTEAVITLRKFLILEGQGAIVVVTVTWDGSHSMK